MHATPLSIIGLLALLLAAMLPAVADTADRVLLAQSTFDIPGELDGWWVDGNANPPTWESPGHLEASDRAKPHEGWWWLAPSKFLARRDALFGARIELDIAQSEADPARYQPNLHGLLLRFEGRGPKGGPRTVVCIHTPVPAPTWTRYAIVLDLNHEWRVGDRTGPPATEEDIRAVLATTENLLIRGEYGARRDTGRLDNVRLWVDADAVASPTLRVAPLGDGRVRLEWTATMETWRLQAASSLLEAHDPGAADAWRALNVPITRNGLLHVTIVPATDSASFFRLVNEP